MGVIVFFKVAPLTNAPVSHSGVQIFFHSILRTPHTRHVYCYNGSCLYNDFTGEMTLSLTDMNILHEIASIR